MSVTIIIKITPSKKQYVGLPIQNIFIRKVGKILELWHEKAT